MQDWTINSDPTFIFLLLSNKFHLRIAGTPNICLETRVFQVYLPLYEGCSKSTRPCYSPAGLKTQIPFQVLSLGLHTHYSQRSFDCWKTLLGMDYSQTIDFCIIYPRDSNQVLFIVSFSAWGVAESHKEQCRDNMEPDKAQESCFWKKKNVQKCIRPSQTLAVI